MVYISIIALFIGVALQALEQIKWLDDKLKSHRHLRLIPIFFILVSGVLQIIVAYNANEDQAIEKEANAKVQKRYHDEYVAKLTTLAIDLGKYGFDIKDGVLHTDSSIIRNSGQAIVVMPPEEIEFTQNLDTFMMALPFRNSGQVTAIDIFVKCYVAMYDNGEPYLLSKTSPNLLNGARLTPTSPSELSPKNIAKIYGQPENFFELKKSLIIIGSYKNERTGEPSTLRSVIHFLPDRQMWGIPTSEKAKENFIKKLGIK